MCKNTISKLSPAGTTENRQRCNPGEPSAVPAGLNHVARCTPGLTSWAKFSRPCGTQFVNPGSHTHSLGLNPELPFPQRIGDGSSQGTCAAAGGQHGDGSCVSIAGAAHATHSHACRGWRTPSPAGPVRPFRENLNSGAVICRADTIPGMREKIVLGAVIELIARTQLATDVETHSSNSDSN